MISVNEAFQIVQSNSLSMRKSISMRIKDACGYILSKDIISPINMPPFRQSAMDGYAVSIHTHRKYKLIGEIKAGDQDHPELKQGEAVRIFTGAAVPDSAGAVIMQEITQIEDQSVIINSDISLEQNIRPKGEQVMAGRIALEKGTKITNAAIGFLASLGLTEVDVYLKPSVSIVVTGNELVQPGTNLQYGQIYESNAIMLASTIKNLGFDQVEIFNVNDDYQNTIEVIQQAITQSQMVIISGGISVGDYDFVGRALSELNVEKLFYKVKQKPGKPLFFGKKEEVMIFALPGNPGAALSCFYMYVYPSMQKMSGEQNFSLHNLRAKSQSVYKKKGERAQFLKAIYENGEVSILDGQNSSMLHSFSLANAFVFLPADKYEVHIDDNVDVILLPLN